MDIKHYKRIDLIRTLSCIAVLFYHIGLLKGGYLAVCIFFVLSGYLLIISAYNKDKFSLKKYYINKFKRLYLPLLIVVFITIVIIKLIPSITYLNLKPEVTSILLGYNNYWQLNANLDYFVRHVNSPFIHLWYIAIILQLELIFPLVFILLKKISKKVRIIPFIILTLLSIGSYIMFYKLVNDGSLMIAYYDTFTRSFSFIIGLILGIIHHYYKPLALKRFNKLIFLIYIIVLIILFFIVNVKSNVFSLSMLATSLISMRLIDYATISNNRGNKIIDFISKISYEVYLVQYPVIFIFQNININKGLKVLLIIVITLVISYIIRFALDISKKSKKKILRIILCIMLLLTSAFGVYKYILEKDHTKEMAKLESDLNKNEELIKEKQKQYIENLKKEEDEWQKLLDDMNSDEDKVREIVTNMKIVGVGDSIMELAVKDLYQVFPNGYFDAVVNRTAKQTNSVLVDLKNKGMIQDIVVLNVGTNGEFYQSYTDPIMETLADKKVYWLNATNADYPTFNGNLYALADKYKNIRIIDWVSVVEPHPEYLISDKVHPTIRGCKVYAETIYNAIYEDYLKEYKEIKEKKIKEHEELEKQKITFIGNDLLLGLYDYIEEDYMSSEFIIKSDFTYKMLEEEIKNKINDKTLNHNVVLAFNKDLDINYNEIKNLCKDYNLYVILVDKSANIKNKDIKVLDYTKELNKKDYFMFDNKHLSLKGNNLLKELLCKELKK